MHFCLPLQHAQGKTTLIGRCQAVHLAVLVLSLVLQAAGRLQPPSRWASSLVRSVPVAARGHGMHMHPPQQGAGWTSHNPCPQPQPPAPSLMGCQPEVLNLWLQPQLGQSLLTRPWLLRPGLAAWGMPSGARQVCSSQQGCSHADVDDAARRAGDSLPVLSHTHPPLPVNTEWAVTRRAGPEGPAASVHMASYEAQPPGQPCSRKGWGHLATPAMTRMECTHLSSMPAQSTVVARL